MNLITSRLDGRSGVGAPQGAHGGSSVQAVGDEFHGALLNIIEVDQPSALSMALSAMAWGRVMFIPARASEFT